MLTAADFFTFTPSFVAPSLQGAENLMAGSNRQILEEGGGPFGGGLKVLGHGGFAREGFEF